MKEEIDPIIIRNCTFIARTGDSIVTYHDVNGEHRSQIKLDGYLIVPLEKITPETLEQLMQEASLDAVTVDP